MGYSNRKAAKELITLGDFIRYGVSRFGESDLFFGHGTDNAFDEAAFMILETLNLPIDALEPYYNARLTTAEKKNILKLFDARIKTRKPASYLLKKAYCQGYPFYVDERVIVPRSYIAEILCAPEGLGPVGDYTKIESVLDLCTGSGCLGIIAADLFPNAVVDCVDISRDALIVAKKNIVRYGLEDRVFLHQGDMFATVEGRRYDLIITNPPYVDAQAMAALPAEFRHEPAIALGAEAGEDGLYFVRQILQKSRAHLNHNGSLLCELGSAGALLKQHYPHKPFQWIKTQTSKDEVFWLPAKNL